VRLLLDTHTLIWSIDDPSRLSAVALAVISDPAKDRVLSAATIWELSIKVGQGKLPLSLPYRPWMDKAIADLKLAMLPITVEYAERQAALPPHHKDPFDRLLIAQALVDGLPIVSADATFDAYGVTRIW
jgi:PIN domain nuclease of toxin-antitoxin system